MRSVKVEGGWHLNCLGVFCLQRFVKTSTPLTLYLQMLCPPKPQRTVPFDAAPPAPMKRSCTGYLAVLAVLWSGVSWAQTAGHGQLHEGARQWVAEQTRTPLSALQVTPLDPRLNIPACAKPIQFDLPFGNRQSVRARCDQPAWQHFVQVMARPEALPAPSVSAAPTQAPTAPRTQSGMVMRQVLVANQVIKRGSVATPQQFSLVEMALPSGETSYLSDASALTHMELQRDLPAQTPLRSYDLKAAQMVRRGQQVMVSVGEGKGFLITLRAEAQQDGILGEQIRLKNPESGRSLSAVITGFNAARAM